ncbi:MAG: MFS transporter, partial [Candidatus Promineifilaceae bacterium]|nr:MFS transporter [Candidatus Promineifilaceae bacterium]
MAATAPPSQPSTLAVFRRRNFTLLWIADFISGSGSALTYLAAGILVFQLTGSATSVGLMLMATAVPSLAVGLIAGVLVDRYDRRRIMIFADATRAILVLFIPFLASVNIIWLYVIVFLTSTLDKFFSPAHESVLPELAPDEELAAANSFIAISTFGSTAIGFAASGIIASAADINWAFYADALTFLTSAGFLLLMRIPKVEAERETSIANVVGNLREGARYLWDSAILRSSFLIGIFVFISFGMWNVLLLPFAIRALGADEFVYGIQEGLTSVGFVLGSLLMAKLADRLREGQWYSLGIIGMGLVGVVYAQATSIPLAIALVMVSGFLNALMAIGRRLIFQRNTTREVRGRVASAYIVAGDVLVIVGMGMAGLADVFDVRLVIAGASLILVAAGGFSLFLPGLGQPAAEWRRAVSYLRGIEAAPTLGAGLQATLANFELLAVHVPAMAGLTVEQRQSLLAKSQVTEAPEGTAIVRRGDTSSEAYFILSGRAVAGRTEGDDYRPLETLNAGDFFGEIAAITGMPRTANVVAEQAVQLLRISA